MNKYLTISDMAERYKLSKASIHSFVRKGLLPRGVHFGGAHRWDVGELEAFEQGLSTAQKGGITA